MTMQEQKETEGADDKVKKLRRRILPPDEGWMEQARAHWMTEGKPLFSLGKLEDAVIQMAGIKRSADYTLEKKALVILCADNGIVAEGVTQTGQEVTAIVAENFTKGAASTNIMAEVAGVDIFPVDIGMAKDVPGLTVNEKKVVRGTKNFAKEPAMSRQEVWKAIETGIGIVKELKEKGYDVIATGEMGIGNTTTSSAVASVLLRKDPEEVTGKGAGLTSEGLRRKIRVIREAIRMHEPEAQDVPDVLQSRRTGYCRDDRALFRRRAVPCADRDRRIYLCCGSTVRGADSSKCGRICTALPCFGRTGRRDDPGSAAPDPFLTCDMCRRGQRRRCRDAASGDGAAGLPENGIFFGYSGRTVSDFEIEKTGEDEEERKR